MPAPVDCQEKKRWRRHSCLLGRDSSRPSCLGPGKSAGMSPGGRKCCTLLWSPPGTMRKPRTPRSTKPACRGRGWGHRHSQCLSRRRRRDAYACCRACTNCRRDKAHLYQDSPVAAGSWTAAGVGPPFGTGGRTLDPDNTVTVFPVALSMISMVGIGVQQPAFGVWPIGGVRTRPYSCTRPLNASVVISSDAVFPRSIVASPLLSNSPGR